jgi:hypothetical protein
MQESGNGDTDRIPPWHDQAEAKLEDKEIRSAETFNLTIKMGRTKSG